MLDDATLLQLDHRYIRRDEAFSALSNQIRAFQEDVMNGFTVVHQNMKAMREHFDDRLDRMDERMDRMEGDIREIREYVGMGKSRH